jgi:subfamily B ATP-binding cassette protein MsbA
MKNYLRIFQYLKPYRFQLFLSICLAIIFSAANVFMVPWLRDMANEVSNSNRDFFTLQILNGVALWTVRVLSRFGQYYLTAWISQRVIWDVQSKIYTKLLGVSQHFYGKWKLGDLLTRMFNDSAKVKEVIILSFRDVIPQVITFVSVLTYLFVMSWKLSLFTFVAIPLFVFMLSYFTTRIKAVTHKVQKKTADITHITQEVISNIKLVQAYTMEGKEQKRYDKEMRRNFNFNMLIARLKATMEAVLQEAQGVIILAILFVGGTMVLNDELTGPELLGYYTGIGLLIDPVQALSNVYVAIQQGMASTDRMFEVLDAKVHISSPKDGVSKTFSGHVKFDNVSFSYDEHNEGEEVLKDFSLEAKEGEIVALVGLSGAGKSTLISLIPRFYDPSSGSIQIDGVDIKDMNLYALRSQIAMVLQEDMMFRGTVSENIRYGTPHAKEKDIIEAAKQANAWEFINDMPSGLRTKVSDKGRRLSGGQKQRISIARAILRNPRILILDEATSALDSKSETLVQEALNKLMKDRTTFVIAHRLSTIMHADKIVVLDKGEIVEVGTHTDLIQKGGHYKRLHDLQFSKKV